jgi:tetratricopeptide (TPR) repeat protein
MPEITFEESLRQISAVRDRVRVSEKEKDWDAALAGLHELLEHPCAHHQVLAYEVWDDIHEIEKQAGHYDAAIAAKQEAVRPGRSEPDPAADIAECHLRAGRREEADAIFAGLRVRMPDDVWLYNAAGFSYAFAEDPAEAARWFREGIEVAIRTGDPDQVVVQLMDGLEDAWKASGEEPEPGLAERVESFTEAWKPLSGRAFPRWDDLPEPEDRPCGHCGYEPDRSWAERDERRRRADRRVLREEMPDVLARLDAISGGRERRRLSKALDLSVAWFPGGEWEKAVERWPDLLDELPAGHAEYSHRIEGRIKRIARAVAGTPMRVSPMTVDGLVAYCAEQDLAPGTAEARSAFAAEIARRGEAIAWPLGRNVACWCGSGRKYKACCGPTQPEADPGGP